MASDLARRRREWDDLAVLDPYWGVLTHPDGKHGAWDRSAFFASGREQIEQALEVAAGFSLPSERRAALDFGSGLGRLTRALAGRFEQAYGVDVSGTLVKLAQDLNGDLANCHFSQLQAKGLAQFDEGSIDLVCSFLVLQHQARRELIADYITEFVRVLRPGGVAVFQIPTHVPLRKRIQPRRRAYATLRAVGVRPEVLYTRLGLDPMRMRHMSRDRIQEVVVRAGGTILTVADDQLAGAFPSSTYYVTTH